MTLRRRSKAVENLRLANFQDYIITEDDSEASPLTIRPRPALIIPAATTGENVSEAFKKFNWQRPKIDGIVLCDYRRFAHAMVVPTKEAVEPWVEWIEKHLGWERSWILENPAATKRAVMTQFEGEQEPNDDQEHIIPWRRFLDIEGSSFRRVESRESIHARKGAVSRMEFREDARERVPLSQV
jgi:hypothetical protein